MLLLPPLPQLLQPRFLFLYLLSFPLKIRLFILVPLMQVPSPLQQLHMFLILPHQSIKIVLRISLTIGIR